METIAAASRPDIAAYARRIAAGDGPGPGALPPHLRQLQAQSIHILREVASAFRNPVLLYSIGKDSSVMLHLAMLAFWPAPPPFRLLHIATGWDFADMIVHRDALCAALGLDLLVAHNEEAAARGRTPFNTDSREWARLMLIDTLKAAMAAHGFDAALGGGRRDEEKSRAKERIFSVRGPGQQWDPRSQRPELWSLFNARLAAGESMRVFPLSNWTELDIWDYIRRCDIPVVPLYFARPRAVVERNGLLLVVDDDRMVWRAGETAQPRRVRFRTLGDWPLSGCIDSAADSLEAVIAEMRASRQSERQGRLVDKDEAASMEKKKREGYF
ncbi:MAG: sulfate adenylyltransferase subunit CysD [Alphaproteobacteria bacterium]|nr:sulfate adenylyltransferase subunit CysD [Alphaproteobacteria bacterium]